MRFTRDRRGYETTALVQASRRRGKGQRILYWFRTPPGVRVGRAPIDEDAIRLLEQHNPDLQFDWTRILKQAPPPEQDVQAAPGQQRRRGPREAAPRTRAQQPPVARALARGETMAREPQVSELEPQLAAAYEMLAEDVLPREPGEEEGYDEAAASEVSERDARSPAFARLGAEGLARLRARYAEMLARISEHPVDEPTREELRRHAERLNPDAWVTAEEVRQALEQYETVFETLRAVFGHGRARRRRG